MLQFRPSSILIYGIDFDNDSKGYLFNSVAVSTASIVKYLKNNEGGEKKNEPTVILVKIPRKANINKILSSKKSVGYFKM